MAVSVSNIGFAPEPRRFNGTREAWDEFKGPTKDYSGMSLSDADLGDLDLDPASLPGAGPGVPGRGRGGRVTKADIEYGAELARLNEEKIALDLALNQATAERNAEQSRLEALGGGGGRNAERIAILQRELANGNPNADGYKIRAAELQKLTAFTADLSQAQAKLGDAEARISAARSAIESIPLRAENAGRRRDFNLEAEEKLGKKERRGKRAANEKELTSIYEEMGKIDKGISVGEYGEDGDPGKEAAQRRRGNLEKRAADLEARGGKRGKGKQAEAATGDDHEALIASLVDEGIPEDIARASLAKETGGTVPEKQGAAPASTGTPAPAPAATRAAASAPLSLSPADAWADEYDRPVVAPASVPVVPARGRRESVGEVMDFMEGRPALSLEPQPFDPPMMDRAAAGRARLQLRSDEREEQRRALYGDPPPPIIARQWEGERNAQGIPLSALEKAAAAVRDTPEAAFDPFQWIHRQVRRASESNRRFEGRVRGKRENQ
jgi:hypothetical protein